MISPLFCSNFPLPETFGEVEIGDYYIQKDLKHSFIESLFYNFV